MQSKVAVYSKYSMPHMLVAMVTDPIVAYLWKQANHISLNSTINLSLWNDATTIRGQTLFEDGHYFHSLLVVFHAGTTCVCTPGNMIVMTEE